MESQVTSATFKRRLLTLALGCGVFSAAGLAPAQEQPAPAGQPEVSLRKSVNSREFQGQQYEGEERQIGRGDSLWRILVEEKGLPGQKFRSYLVVIRGLNPQVKNFDVLRIGDKIFVPLRLEEASNAGQRAERAVDRGAAKTGTTVNYRIKAGEHLYQILREQLKLTEERKLAQYYALVRDLNPERKDWDTLVEGEIIRLPTAGTNVQTQTAESGVPAAPKSGAEAPATVEAKPKPESKLAPTRDVRRALVAPARENMPLVAQIVEAMGIEMQQTGEEAVVLKDGTVRFDRSAYPVLNNPAFRQKLVIDPNGKIPASLKTKLNDPNVSTPVLPIADGVSIQQAVGQLLAGLGYQSLPADRPVVIQEEGITFEAKGDWMVLAPEVSNKTQEVYVINVTDRASEIPGYLKSELAKKGLQLREVVLPSQTSAQVKPAVVSEPRGGAAQVKNWPRQKQEIVDALLLSYGVAFGVADNLSVELGDGLRVDTRTDRLFELAGQRTALFFHPVDAAIRDSLRDKQGIRTVELDLKTLSTRELISRLLSLLGDQSDYREHRFSAASGSARGKVTVNAWGFQLTKKPMFVTDRQIPPALYPFFFEKGLEIVYFQ